MKSYSLGLVAFLGISAWAQMGPGVAPSFNGSMALPGVGMGPMGGMGGGMGMMAPPFVGNVMPGPSMYASQPMIGERPAGEGSNSGCTTGRNDGTRITADGVMIINERGHGR